jgi:hypothetical protein
MSVAWSPGPIISAFAEAFPFNTVGELLEFIRDVDESAPPLGAHVFGLPPEKHRPFTVLFGSRSVCIALVHGLRPYRAQRKASPMMAAISPNTRSHDRVAIIRSGSFLIARVGFEWGNYFLPASRALGNKVRPMTENSHKVARSRNRRQHPPAVSLHARKAVLGYPGSGPGTEQPIRCGAWRAARGMRFAARLQGYRGGCLGA